MHHIRFLTLVPLLILSGACGVISPTLVTVATPTPQDTPLPIHQTFKIELWLNCGMEMAGSFSVFPQMEYGKVKLCFEDPEFYEKLGAIDYFVLIVTHKYLSPKLQIVRYGQLENFLPTATPYPTQMPGPTPTFPRVQRTPSAPPYPMAPTPYVLRTMTLEVNGICDKPVSSTSLDKVVVCFAIPEEQEEMKGIEYWSVTILRARTPTAQYGLLEWSTPTP